MESHDRGEIAGEQGGHTDSEKQQPTVKDKLLNASAVRQVYLAVRWKIFHFNVRIAEQNQKEIRKCAKCFATLILE